MNRRRFSEREVILTLMMQGVTVHCYRCRKPFVAFDDIEREHFLEIAFGGSDEPHNCVYSHAECHSIVTNGTKATTAGSSKHRIGKVKRIVEGKKRKGPPIKSRGFSKDKRPMQSRPFSGR